MLFRKTILSLIALFMSVSGTPVYAENSTEPEMAETDNHASSRFSDIFRPKKLYAESEATLISGPEFNVICKKLAGDGDNVTVETVDGNIGGFIRSTTAPDKTKQVVDISKDGDSSIVAWLSSEKMPGDSYAKNYIFWYSSADKVFLNENSSNMFRNIWGTNEDAASEFDTSRATDMSYMFFGNTAGWIDLSNFNTSSVTNMEGMFANSQYLYKLTFPDSFVTDNVINMSYMFSGDGYLGRIGGALDLSGFNTDKVTDMSYMFTYCHSLEKIDFSGWNTGHVTNMSHMFSDCRSMTSLDISSFDTSQVKNMSNMFNSCVSMESLNLSGIDTSKVTDMSGMFAYFGQYTDAPITLDLSDFDVSEVSDMSEMFESASTVKNIYIGAGWNTDKVTKSSDMFTGCSKLPHFNSSIVDKTNANAGPLGYMSKKPLRYLPDTVFTIYGTSDYGNPVSAVVTSDKSGRMSFKNLEKGTYTLTEVSPTDGYIKNSVKYTVTVTDSGVSIVPDNADYYYETPNQKVLFNEPYHAFTIQKASSTDSTIGVAGAEFLLSGVSDYGTEVSQTRTTGSTGIATFDHLEAGNYLLTETKAPEHYALDPVPRVVSINKYGVVKIDGLSKEGSSFLWTDIRNADGTITITKKWNDTLTGTNAAGRALPSIVISTQRTIPDAVTVTYYAGDGYFGTDQTNTENRVTYSEVIDQKGNILSVNVSKGQEMSPSISGKKFDAWYLDSALTKKAPDSIADYIKANPDVREISLYAKYKVPPVLTTGKEFNAAIKTLAAGSSKSYDDMYSLIQSIQMVDTPPSASTFQKDVSANNDGSYLAWWDAGTHTIKLYSESGDVVLNPDSSYMFYYCSSLTTLDVSNWDTSQVKDVSSMFEYCDKLTTMNLSGWDTSQVTDMSSMFHGCSSLTTLNVSNWNTSQVTNMYSMFQNCSSFTTLAVSNWNTSLVTNMRYMFYECSKLTALGVSNWNTGKVTNMRGMFNGCGSLTTLDLSSWDTSQVTSMYSMFENCSNLTTLDLSSWDTSQVTSMYSMFENCSNLATLNVSNWNTDKVTDMGSMFYWCSSLTTLNASNWNTSQVTNMKDMFQYCGRLTTLDVSKWNTDNVTDMTAMFAGCSSLTTLDVSNWNTSQVTSMYRMFAYCYNLSTLDVSNWNTSQVTDMGDMFSNCNNLTTLNASNWNTSQVTSMQYMFVSCSSLTTLDVSKWNTGNVTDMSYMFNNCSSLTTLNASNWNTSQVTTMYYMFYGCSKLTTLGASKWDTSKVTDMSYMFYNCRSLTTLDVSNWNTTQVTRMFRMFDSCRSLTTIYIGPNWNTDKVTDSGNMFRSCNNLPHFNPDVVDKTNAHAGAGGYMTLKS